MRAYLALMKIDLKLAVRQRMVIFFNYLFPLVFFFVFAQAFKADQGGGITIAVTMVAVIGILGNGLFGAGMRAVQERENNILRRYKVTPISPAPLLVASMVTGLLLYLPLLTMMLVVAHFRYGMPFPPNVLSVLAFASIGLVAFRAIGLTVASVVNSTQESAIVTQLLYLPMLFMSGASFPIEMFPKWLRTVSGFIPATYLKSGLESILVQKASILSQQKAVGALVLTALVATFVSMKLFRWEKEEKIKPAAKLWLVAVLAPFFLMGAWQIHSQENEVQTKILSREMSRSRSWLIRHVRIFTGDGKTIESGAVLIRGGKIAEVYEGEAPDPKELHAEPIEGAGLTLLPGLVDVHVHLGAPGGDFQDPREYQNPRKYMQRELAAYLYAGVTAVKSAGDVLDVSLKLRQINNSGERLGAELFLSGPLFTAPRGHGTEYFKGMPEMTRQALLAQFVRVPKDAAEAKAQVDALKQAGVDGIKTVLESGWEGQRFERIDKGLFQAVVAEARAQGLPVVSHTGDARDVADALHAGVNGIEHGSLRDQIPDAAFEDMKRGGVAYDPTLSVAEALHAYAAGDLSELKRPLVQKTAPPDLLAGIRKSLLSPESAKQREWMAKAPFSLTIGQANLVRAWKAGVLLVTGSDAGNQLVIHGPTVQRELELWVDAGIPNDVALRAATSNAARLLRSENRFGTIRKGLDATMILVEGNPLTDIHAMSLVSSVFLKGERVGRQSLFDED